MCGDILIHPGWGWLNNCFCKEGLCLDLFKFVQYLLILLYIIIALVELDFSQLQM